MRVTPSERFLRAFRKLKPNKREKIARVLEKFLSEPMPTSLDFRRLAGAPGFHVIDSSDGDRVLLRKLDDDHYEVVDFGPHDSYRKWNRR